MTEPTIFESSTYYLIMAITGWILVIAQITFAVWVVKKLWGRDRNA
jgi:flagellar biogenesis protein FliO